MYKFVEYFKVPLQFFHHFVPFVSTSLRILGVLTYMWLEGPSHSSWPCLFAGIQVSSYYNIHRKALEGAYATSGILSFITLCKVTVQSCLALEGEEGFKGQHPCSPLTFHYINCAGIFKFQTFARHLILNITRMFLRHLIGNPYWTRRISREPHKSCTSSMAQFGNGGSN